MTGHQAKVITLGWLTLNAPTAECPDCGGTGYRQVLIGYGSIEDQPCWTCNASGGVNAFVLHDAITS